MNKLFYLIFCLISHFAFAEDPAEILKTHFPEKSITSVPLSGGMSGTALYKVNVEGDLYVLRIHQNPSDQDLREHYAIMEAAKMGIAPKVVYHTPTAILMEYIKHPTLSIEQAKQPETCIQIAEAIRKAHTISGHPFAGETLLSKAKRCSEFLLKTAPEFAQQIEGALKIIKSIKQSSIEVEVHADLNPRNIFVTQDAVLFIDWAETTREDPFYDLTYFSQKLDYSEDEEHLLLKSYLMKEPNEEEKARFQIQKKLHQAFWCLTNLYLALNELKKNPDQPKDYDSPLKPWGYYQHLYSDPTSELSFQYFYDLSRLNYLLAATSTLAF